MSRGTDRQQFWVGFRLQLRYGFVFFSYNLGRLHHTFEFTIRTHSTATAQPSFNGELS
jgi:hypothetical protein